MLYWLPAIAIVAVGPLAISSGWRVVCLDCRASHNGHGVYCERAALWARALLPHGPFFLLMALVALSYGLGILHLAGNAWNPLGLITLMGALALWCLPEMFWEDMERAARILATLLEAFLSFCPSFDNVWSEVCRSRSRKGYYGLYASRCPHSCLLGFARALLEHQRPLGKVNRGTAEFYR
jgi:hypothetical protein